ncbi:MAG: DUF192 domain-containing protein [Treponemataceae bacterium]|nr:DUF192 domain-containing protein [Treponemataceae bacterium]
MRRAFFLAAACLLVCAVASCKSQKFPVKTVTIRTASGNDITVAAELAVTDEQRQRGFMERRTIPDGTGMLFVFENDQILHFWMKNTPHPLSIAYIDRDGTIRDVFDMTPFSLASVASTVSVRYALEVPQGWFAKVGVRTGDVVLFP